MKTEDLFKYGVTPIDGPKAGKKFEVYNIDKDGVFVKDEKGTHTNFPHGSYKLWEPPKTLFEDDSIEPTWGNLKKAFEAMGLPDDTRFISDPTTFDMFTLLSPSRGYAARFRIVKHVGNNGDESKEIMVY